MNVNSEFILGEMADGIATITLNRPDKLNAMTRDMAAGLISLIDEFDANDEVRAIVITGAGRAFCAGADLKASNSRFARGAAGRDRSEPTLPDGSIDWTHEDVRDFGGRITLRLFDCLKPLIVAINGPAAGMGVTMPLAADFRLASTTSKFVLPFVRRGIVPESASSWFLPRIVGISRALDWTLTGRSVDSNEALASGLVRSLHEPADLMPAARALAQEIAENAAPVSVALTRQLMWRMLGADHPMEAHKIESRGVFARSKSRDIREGVASFLEKRMPRFDDRPSHDMPSFYPWWPKRDYD
jgi:enoyl-CoA hydratase/carnithine racemase